MDTGRLISCTSLLQVNDRLFNHSVHLSRVEVRATLEQTEELRRVLEESGEKLG
jgi:hypothetical protein